MPYNTIILYCTMLYRTILFFSIPHGTTPYHTVCHAIQNAMLHYARKCYNSFFKEPEPKEIYDELLRPLGRMTALPMQSLRLSQMHGTRRIATLRVWVS